MIFFPSNSQDYFLCGFERTSKVKDWRKDLNLNFREKKERKKVGF